MSNSEGHVPPYNGEAESAVLGSVIIDNECWGAVYSLLNAGDFYLESNRRIFKNMSDLFSAGVAVDPVTLGNKLVQSGEMEMVGGVLTLGELTNVVASTANVGHYANIVREKAAIRNVIRGAQRIVSEGFYDRGVDGLSESVEGLIQAAQMLARTRMPESLLQMGETVMRNYELVASGYRGIEIPWPSLDSMTAGFWPKTMTIFVARPGTGKCVAEDTLICDSSDGVYRTVKEVFERRRPVWTRDDNGGMNAVVPDAYLDTGSKRCVRLKLASGREISVTPEHPLYTVDGWKCAGEMAVGEYVEIAGKVPEPLNVRSVSGYDIVLLAALLSEGGCTSDQLTFTNGDKNMISILRNSAKNIGAELIQTEGMRPSEWKLVWDKHICPNGRWQSLGPNPARVLLDVYGCGNTNATDKVIPDIVFSWCDANIAMFLGFFWGSDGYVTKRDIGITLASEEMVRQIQRLLLRLGIRSSVSYKSEKSGGKVFDFWRLRVYPSCAGRFVQMIDPVVENKRKALDEFVDSDDPNIDNVPITENFRRRVASCIPSDSAWSARLNREVAKLLGRGDFSPNEICRRKTVSKRTLEAFAKVYGEDWILPLVRNSWDEIVAVEDDGVRRVYDLTVMGTHNFLANDIVAHNTFVAIICARHAWMTGKRVLVISPEMSKEEIAERFFTIHAGISYHNVISGQLATMQKGKLESTIDGMRGNDGLWIMDSEDDLSPKGIESAIRACRPDMVACDSIYDLQIKGDRKDRALGALDFMKRNSKELGYAAVGFAQQNRSAELTKKQGGGARLGTIALADEIGQDAHAVFALSQSKDDKDDKVLHFKPLKLRRGQFKKDEVKANWDFERMFFDEIIDESEEDEWDEKIPF